MQTPRPIDPVVIAKLRWIHFLRSVSGAGGRENESARRMASSNSGGLGTPSTRLMRQLVQSIDGAPTVGAVSTRRRLTGHAHLDLHQVRRERHPRAAAGPREITPELLPHGQARLLPAARATSATTASRGRRPAAKHNGHASSTTRSWACGDAHSRASSRSPLSRRKRERAPKPAPGATRARSRSHARDRVRRARRCSSSRACGARTRSPRSASRSPRERGRAAL